MAVLHQELGAVLLRRDRILGRQRLDPQVGDIQLVSAGGALIGAYRARHIHRRLLGQLLGRGERFVADIALEYDALDRAAAVAQLQKHQLAFFGLVINPAGQRHLLAVVPGDVLDICGWKQ